MRRDLFLQLRSLLSRRRGVSIDPIKSSRSLATLPAPPPPSVLALLPDQWRGGDYVLTPPVRLFDGAAEAPSAVSWLRRRLVASSSATASATTDLRPPPSSLLYKLFRERQVRLARLVGPAVRVTRIGSPTRQLDEGDVLLVPRAAFQEDEEAAVGEGVLGRGDQGPRATTPHPRSQAAPTTSVLPSDVRGWIVAKHPDFFVLNKPAGVKVHGLEPRRGGGGAARPPPPTLDLRTRVLRRALGGGGNDGASDEGPRPVHRLDQRASGCLVVARDRDAAAWLGAALERGNSGSGGSVVDDDAWGGGGGNGEGRRAAPPANVSVVKTYLALVERAALAGASEQHQHLSNSSAGTLRTRDWAGGRLRWSVTKYRVLAEGHAPRSPPPPAGKGGKRGAATLAGGGDEEAAAPAVLLVELSPRTGRKHQLRRHCAKRLGAPIVGDWRYGWRRGAGGGGREGGWESEDDEDEAEEDEAESGREGARRRQRQRRLGDQEAAAAPRPPQSSPLPPPPPMSLERVLSRAAAAAGGMPPPLLLHARELVVHRPGGPPLRAVAPLPHFWRTALRLCGIEPPPRDR